MALHTIFSFFNQIIYLESCKKCMYNAIIQDKPVLHVYFYNIFFYTRDKPEKSQGKCIFILGHFRTLQLLKRLDFEFMGSK